jgi:hypothetical protein
MRLSIYDLFTVGVVRPDGGWSKGRPIAFIEEDDRCVPLFDLVIPNDLDDAGLVRYVSNKFAAFARPGARITILDGDDQDRRMEVRQCVAYPAATQWGAAHSAFAGVQH